MSDRFSGQIIDVSTAMGIAVEKLTLNESESVRLSLARRYSSNILCPNLGELAHFESIHDSQAWTWLSDFVGDEILYVFFRRDDDPFVIKLLHGKSIVRIIGECTGFAFFIAAFDEHYLLQFDDHDCLIGTGSAAEWIRQLKSSE
jgi:hypothetical protein